MYEVAVDEKDIAPMDLFDYEIIDEAETGALKLSALPTKKVRIIQIKEEYCNSFQNPEHKDTNYEILYKGEKISDTLVIPYKVDGKYVNEGKEGEMYTIVEVQLFAFGVEDDTGMAGYSFPRVETVIYPNTVEVIYGKECWDEDRNQTQTLKTVILPNKVKIIGENAFNGCYKLNNMIVPDSVIEIGKGAFPNNWINNFMDNLPDGEIYIGKIFYGYKGEIPNGTSIQIKEGTVQIMDGALWGYDNLISITIPDSVTSIGGSAFSECTNLASITIPNSVTSMGAYVFSDWTPSQTINVPFKEGEKPDGWDEYWKSGCNATINYLK